MKLPVKPPVSPMLSKSVPAIPPSPSYEPSESQTSIGVRVGSSRWPGSEDDDQVCAVDDGVVVLDGRVRPRAITDFPALLTQTNSTVGAT